MGRHLTRSRSRSRGRSGTPVRRKRYDEPRRERRHERESPAPSGLLVRNISLSARPEDLRVPFERFGPIKDVYLPKNYYTGEPRGFGFVKFRHPGDAAEAKSHLDRSVVGGREIRIVYAEENRKTPQEMRKVTHVSSRGSHRRRSRSMSPRRRHHSYSSSPSPARHESRNRGRRSKNDSISPQRQRSVSHRDDKRREKSRSDYDSSRRQRSVSRSVSPRDDKRHERSKNKSVSRSVSPKDDRRLDISPNQVSSSPKENGPTTDEPIRSQSPRRNSKIPVRSHYRSHSPR